MAELDQEDINFLEELAKELRRFEGVYNAEADELENIIFRAKGEGEYEEDCYCETHRIMVEDRD